jgi:hypothetical protein
MTNNNKDEAKPTSYDLVLGGSNSLTKAHVQAATLGGWDGYIQWGNQLKPGDKVCLQTNRYENLLQMYDAIKEGEKDLFRLQQGIIDPNPESYTHPDSVLQILVDQLVIKTYVSLQQVESDSFYSTNFISQRAKYFNPLGIAYNPITQHLYATFFLVPCHNAHKDKLYISESLYPKYSKKIIVDTVESALAELGGDRGLLEEFFAFNQKREAFDKATSQNNSHKKRHNNYVLKPMRLHNYS